MRRWKHGFTLSLSFMVQLILWSFIILFGIILFYKVFQRVAP